MFYQPAKFTDNTAELIAKFKAEGGEITRKVSKKKARTALKETFINEKFRSY
jgi:hypothetical protein